MKPMLDPARDLAGATPETLAKALFRRTQPLRPGTRRQPVVRDQVTVEEVPTDELGDGVAHLDERFLSRGRCACPRIWRHSVAGASG